MPLVKQKPDTGFSKFFSIHYPPLAVPGKDLHHPERVLLDRIGISLTQWTYFIQGTADRQLYLTEAIAIADHTGIPVEKMRTIYE